MSADWEIPSHTDLLSPQPTLRLTDCCYVRNANVPLKGKPVERLSVQRSYYYEAAPNVATIFIELLLRALKYYLRPDTVILGLFRNPPTMQQYEWKSHLEGMIVISIIFEFAVY